MRYVSDKVETLLARGALTDYTYHEVGQENTCPHLSVLIANGTHDVFIDAADSLAVARRLRNATTIFYSGGQAAEKEIGRGDLLTFPWAGFHVARPGNCGQSPPRVSSAMAMSASGL